MKSTTVPVLKISAPSLEVESVGFKPTLVRRTHRLAGEDSSVGVIEKRGKVEVIAVSRIGL